MEAQWLTDRARLRALLQTHPHWTNQAYADALGYSPAWVKKWKRRFSQAGDDDDAVLHSRSRARHSAPPKIDPSVVEAILRIRDEPPDNLRRTPGPKAILYYLHRDSALAAAGTKIPTSHTTIWRILDAHQRIIRPAPYERLPVDRPEPMVEWQVDFKDVTTARSAPDEHVAHDIQTFDVVDAGTSILVANPVRNDFNATTVIETLAAIFQASGMPQAVRFDRDTRFVGSWTGRGFPTAFMRFLLCLGIEPIVNPPRQPQMNCFVERFHRTYEYECLQVDRPADLAATREVNLAFKRHYNFERPNQAPSCGNQPPRLAHPVLPVLPRPPADIDPDRWLDHIAGRYFKRRVNPRGAVTIGRQIYYIGSQHARQDVVVMVQAQSRLLDFIQDRRVIRSAPLKGLHERRVPFDDYLELIGKEAESEYRQALAAKRRRVATI